MTRTRSCTINARRYGKSAVARARRDGGVIDVTLYVAWPVPKDASVQLSPGKARRLGRWLQKAGEEMR